VNLNTILDQKKNYKNGLINNNFDTVIHLAAIVPIKMVNQNKKKALDVNYGWD
jgi:dTDP-4-dehydrorhamnose reductase